MLSLSFATLLAVAAQASPAPPLDAPPALAEPAPDRAAPTLEGDDGEYEPPGLGSAGRVALQTLTGCAGTLVLGPVAAVPIIGVLAYPALVATLVTVVGDMTGQTRGALLWPILAGYGAGVLGTGVIVGSVFGAVGIFVGGFASLIAIYNENPNPLAFVGVFLATYAAAVAVILAGVAIHLVMIATAPVCAYALTSENKRPGDSKFRFPGVLVPNHDDGEPPKQVQRRPGDTRVVDAMAY